MHSKMKMFPLKRTHNGSQIVIRLTGSITPAKGAKLASPPPAATIFSSCFSTGSIDVHSCFIVKLSNLWPASRIVAPALCGLGAVGVVAVVSSGVFPSFLSPLASSFGSLSAPVRDPLAAFAADRLVVRSAVSSCSASRAGFREDDLATRLGFGFDMVALSTHYRLHHNSRRFLYCKLLHWHTLTRNSSSFFVVSLETFFHHFHILSESHAFRSIEIGTMDHVFLVFFRHSTGLLRENCSTFCKRKREIWCDKYENAINKFSLKRIFV